MRNTLNNELTNAQYRYRIGSIWIGKLPSRSIALRVEEKIRPRNALFIGPTGIPVAGFLAVSNYNPARTKLTGDEGNIKGVTIGLLPS